MKFNALQESVIDAAPFTKSKRMGPTYIATGFDEEKTAVVGFLSANFVDFRYLGQTDEGSTYAAWRVL